jgi:chemotaxis methyl-accepting protein methylase
VVGASTGEEAWSVAMLLAEACPPPGAFEVLASDLDPAALEVARSGRYAREAALAVPERLRARFLTPEGGAVRMVPELRERVRFARHDLMGRRLAPPEAVVASFDLVLCRNVLIYFTRRLQEKAFERLAELLRPGNLLVMGLAEWLPGRLAESFAPLDARLKIYRRRERRP